MLCGFDSGIDDSDRVDSIAAVPNRVDSMKDSATTGVGDEAERVVVPNIYGVVLIVPKQRERGNGSIGSQREPQGIEVVLVGV